jgi:hypothetical protein
MQVAEQVAAELAEQVAAATAVAVMVQQIPVVAELVLTDHLDQVVPAVLAW